MISIIVPVFNVAEYIEPCLQSILQEKFTRGYEVILIDDCSTDDSHRICQNFVNKFPEIFKLISHEKIRALAFRATSEINGAHPRTSW